MRHFLAASLWAFATACAAPAVQRPVHLDPSNPDAPEANPVALPTALRPAAASTSPNVTEEDVAANEHSSHGAVPGAPTRSDGEMGSGSSHRGQLESEVEGETPIFECPMHPEVRQNEPGRCPKCGMKLVPKKGQSAGHEHHRGPEQKQAPARSKKSGSRDAGAVIYVCPMHPEVTDTKPSQCPKCGMKLVPSEPDEQGQAPSAPAGVPREQHHGHGADGGHP